MVDPTYLTFPGANEVIEGAQGFVYGDFGMRPVNLVKVNVVGPQSAKACLCLLHDVAARDTLLIRIIVRHWKMHLCRQNDSTPASRFGRGLPPVTSSLFSSRIAVGGVENVDAGLNRAVDDANGFLQAGSPPKHHAAQRERGNF